MSKIHKISLADSILWALSTTPLSPCLCDESQFVHLVLDSYIEMSLNDGLTQPHASTSLAWTDTYPSPSILTSSLHMRIKSGISSCWFEIWCIMDAMAMVPWSPAPLLLMWWWGTSSKTHSWWGDPGPDRGGRRQAGGEYGMGCSCETVQEICHSLPMTREYIESITVIYECIVAAPVFDGQV